MRRNSERGIALVLALVLAVLYFGLIELLLVDSARELGEARRFRARIMAETLAENGVELAARQIVKKNSADVKAADWQGSVVGTMRKHPAVATEQSFDIIGDGVTSGITESRARVLVRGRVLNGSAVRIQYTIHTYQKK